MKHIELSKNNLSGTIPTELAQLTNVIILDISGNYLTGGIADEFTYMNGILFSKNAHISNTTNTTNSRI